MNLILPGVLAYVAVQLLVGWWVSRRIRTEDDYLLAGRRMGYLLATGSIFATWFGAETCVGAAGEVFDGGLALSSAEPFGYGLCLVAMGLVFARPLWKRKLVTLADLFRARFSGGVERLAAALMIPTSVLWAAAQVRALGVVLSTSAPGLEVELAIALAAGIAVVYTSFGGLLADAINDLIQGAALTLGLALLLVIVVSGLGGPSGALEAIDPARLSWAGSEGPWLATVEAWAIPILGSVVAQELVARVSASRSANVAQRSALAAGGIYLAVGLIPVALGLLAPALLEPLEHGEHVLPALARQELSPVLYPLFAGGLVAAILSTVDSTLLVSSSLLSHNVVQPLLLRLDERAKLRLARCGVIGFGAIACLLALGADGVFALVEEASAFGSAGVVVSVVFGLFTRLGRRASAYAALLAGTAVYVASGAFGCPYPYLASLAAALAAYLAGAVLALKPRSQAAPQHRSA